MREQIAPGSSPPPKRPGPEATRPSPSCGWGLGTRLEKVLRKSEPIRAILARTNIKQNVINPRRIFPPVYLTIYTGSYKAIRL